MAKKSGTSSHRLRLVSVGQRDAQSQQETDQPIQQSHIEKLADRLVAEDKISKRERDLTVASLVADLKAIRKS